MLQAIIKGGRVVPVNVPTPMVSSGSILIQVVNSCISAGTELVTVEGSGRSLIRRALDQPENVKKLMSMARSDGIARSLAKMRRKLHSGSSTGYSLSGVAIAVGEGVTDLRVGDHVAAAGGGIANHAEFVNVPRNLVVRIPDGLGFAEASTVALGAIAMQAIRRAQLQLGEFAVVFGAGILGQLAIQMLCISGARTLAIDLDQNRLRVAREAGAEAAFNPAEGSTTDAVLHYTGGRGADIVLFCASTSDPRALSEACAMTRKKGRVIILGVWGKELNRADIYSKELDLLISTSYGPGRYDNDYESRGLDYPYAYVRWTENRNMAEYLRLLANGGIRLQQLIQAVFPLDQVENAFRALKEPNRPLMVLLDYGACESPINPPLIATHRRVAIGKIGKLPSGTRIRVGLVGAGAFAVSTHLPNLLKLSEKYEIHALCSRNGYNAQSVATDFGARYSTTEYCEILKDPEVDLVIICTRHILHGQMVLQAIKAGKHVFVEKPLCTSFEELEAIRSFYDSEQTTGSMPLLMVGFNRRFSKFAREIKSLVQKRINPLFIHYRMNAGYIPLEHWVHSEQGGGRIVGEACHIIDLFSFLIESRVKKIGVSSFRPKTASLSSSDNKVITLEYEDGSLATLDYFAVGSKKLPKEHMEIHFDEKTILMNDYKSIEGYGIKTTSAKSKMPEKGHLEQMEVLASSIGHREGEWPININSLLETTLITLEISNTSKFPL